MNLNKKLLTLLAIFCIIASAGIVCAEDQGGYAGSNKNMSDTDGLEPCNGLLLENHVDNIPLDSDSTPILNTIENATGNTTGNVTTDNATGNATDNTTENSTPNATENTTGNVTGNATSNVIAHHTLPVSGNPVIALLAVISLVGGYAALKRNK